MNLSIIEMIRVNDVFSPKDVSRQKHRIQKVNCLVMLWSCCYGEANSPFAC